MTLLISEERRMNYNGRAYLFSPSLTLEVDLEPSEDVGKK
jgi:hypothetical protein